MKHLDSWLILLSVALMPLAACLGTPGGPPLSGQADPSHPARPVLSEAATLALAGAEQDILRARAGFALWTSTQAAYELARDAAAAGDSRQVIEQARIVGEQVEIALRQKAYPSTERR